MELYLLRHAQAVSEWQDPLQPLSMAGRQDIERLALWQQANRLIETETIFHSSKLRAKQTAEIFQSIGLPSAKTIEKTGLMPNDSVENQRFFIEEEWPIMYPNRPNFLIVGHLPYLERLVSLLLFNHPDKSTIDIQPCTVVCLTGNHGSWVIKWVIPPLVLKHK